MTESPSPAAVVEQVEFVKGIVTVPEDDTRRLVYADWLEEHDGTVPCPRRGSDPTFSDCGEPCPVCRGLNSLSNGYRERAEFIRRSIADTNHIIELDDGQALYLLDHRTIIFRLSRGMSGTVTRGFLSAVTCTAADWLAHADRLYWHPNQKCDCVGRVHPPTECGHCLGTGFRPFPTDPLPHPITAVRLTTLPVHMSWGLVRLFSNDDGTCRDDRWPSVTFRLPTPA